MSSLRRSRTPGRIAHIGTAGFLLVGLAASAALGQPGPSTLADDMARAVATAAEIAAQRDTEAREAQAAASRALREAAEAQARAETALERAQALEVQATATQAERDAARAEAEALRADAAEKEAARVDLARQAADAEAQARDAQARATALEQRLAQEERRFYATLVVGALVLLAVVLPVWRITKRRQIQWQESEAARRATDERLVAAVVPAAFSCLLAGTDTDGRSVVVKIGAEQLGSADGVVVGRNPAQAGVVLDHPEASREHFRLTARDGGLFVVDLHSTNGTFVNGTEVRPPEASALSPGDEIRLGAAIRLTVSMDRVTP